MDQLVKNPSACHVGDLALKEGMGTHSSVLAHSTPWTEEPGGLQSMGSQRVGHARATKHSTHKGVEG